MGKIVVKMSVWFIIFKLKVLFELDPDISDWVVSHGDWVGRVLVRTPPKSRCKGGSL